MEIFQDPVVREFLGTAIVLGIILGILYLIQE